MTEWGEGAAIKRSLSRVHKRRESTRIVKTAAAQRPCYSIPNFRM